MFSMSGVSQNWTEPGPNFVDFPEMGFHIVLVKYMCCIVLPIFLGVPSFAELEANRSRAERQILVATVRTHRPCGGMGSLIGDT